MNWLDLAIVGLLVGGFLWSFRQGFIMEIIYFVAAIVGLLGAFPLYPFMKPVIKTGFPNSVAASSVSFAIVFVLLGALVVIVGLLFHKFIYMIHLGIFDRLLGGVFGLAKVAMIITVALVMFVGAKGKNTPEYVDNSLICKPLLKTSTTAFESVPMLFQTFHEDYGKKTMKWLLEKQEQLND